MSQSPTPEAAPAAAVEPIPEMQVVDTLDALKVISDPLRLSIRMFLTRRDMTVKELGELLDQPVSRLYHHVAELERVGLIRQTRSEVKFGIIQKYYRAVARLLDVPLTLLHDHPDGEESQLAANFHLHVLEDTTRVLRHVLTHHHDEVNAETLSHHRQFIRLTPGQARELNRRLDELFAEFTIPADEADAPDAFDAILLGAIVPARQYLVTGWLGDESEDIPESDPRSL